MKGSIDIHKGSIRDLKGFRALGVLGLYGVSGLKVSGFSDLSMGVEVFRV